MYATRLVDSAIFRTFPEYLPALRPNQVFLGPLLLFCKIHFVPLSAKSARLSPWLAAAVWALVVAAAALYGVHLGFSGRAFFIGLAVAAVLFAFELFLACPTILEKFSRSPAQLALPLVILIPSAAALLYSLALVGNWRLALAALAYALVPLSLAALSRGRPAGTWQDYAAILLIWLPVEFRWMYRVFVFPTDAGLAAWPLTHTLTILLAVGTALSAFLLIRRFERIGYSAEWRRGDASLVLSHFALFVLIAVPLGLALHFLAWAPSGTRLRALPLSAAGILFFTAWPEEFLFRGLLQNAFSRTLHNRWAALALAAVIFGLSHILHAPYPNWKYVVLATIAGLFYGHAWMKSGSLVPGALLHALVDISWHILFR